MPLVLVDIVAEGDLRVDIVTKQVDLSLVGIAIHGWELEEGLLDATVVVDMDRVFEHEVAEVLVRLHEVVQHLQILQIAPLTIVEDVKAVLVRVQLHVLALIEQLGLLIHDRFVSLLELLLLLLQTADLLVYLLLHHCVQILLLNFQLLHDSAEGLLQPLNLIVELLANLQLKLTVEFLTRWCLLFVGFYLGDHLCHHALHIDH